jgi:hypothetical protein
VENNFAACDLHSCPGCSGLIANSGAGLILGLFFSSRLLCLSGSVYTDAGINADARLVETRVGFLGAVIDGDWIVPAVVW